MSGKEKNLYIGEGAGPNLVPFYADNKSKATTMAKEMKLKSFGKLTGIKILKPTT
jgi:hypothetical protein